MKQPDLGQKIQNWRKAKGLTQEELVEQCNLNVRTLQRIEAGEVLPRSYTVKSILEVLGVDFSVLNFKENKQVKIGDLLKDKKSMIKWAAIIGIFYLCLAFVEGFMEIGLYYDFVSSVSAIEYTLVKLGIMISFTVFYYAVYVIGKALDDSLMSISAIVMISLIVISNSHDIIAFYTEYISVEALLLIRSVIFGIGYIFIGTALALRNDVLGKLSLVTGIFGIVTGLGFLTVVMAIPALFTLTVFEILLVILIVRSISSKNSSMESESNNLSSALI